MENNMENEMDTGSIGWFIRIRGFPKLLLKRGNIRDHIGYHYRASWGDTRILDYSSYEGFPKLRVPFWGVPRIRIIV